MIYPLGLFFILLFNIAIAYDQAQHNKEIYKLNQIVFFITMSLFCILEMIFFSMAYVTAIKIVEVFK